MRTLSVLFFVLSAIVFSSCESEGGDESDFNAEHFHFEIKEMTCSYKDCDINEGDCSFISINYPQFTHRDGDEVLSKISGSIDRIILGEEAGSPKELCDQFIFDYDSFKNDSLFIEDDYSVAWYDIREAEWLSIQKRVLSFSCSINSFYGGAHPNVYLYLRNFDPQTGDSLGLAMIFNEASLKEVTKIGENIFRKDYEIGPKTSFDSMGYWFENDVFELSTNFAFTDQGLLFYYNSYDIAPYSMGPSQILIPYSTIMHLFK